jgi:replicative DNA helicase
MTKRIEEVILSQIINDDEYARKVIPFLQDSYFHDRRDREVFKLINNHFIKYNQTPDVTTLSIDADKIQIKKDEFDQIQDIISSLTHVSDKADWLIERTEKFCKEKAIHNAIMRSIDILDGKDKEYTEDALPSLLADAISVSFNKSVGHDFYEDVETRYDFYHLKEDRLRFDLEMFNKVTKGGIPRKTLNAVLAPTGVGKSLFLCHHAAATLKQGKNALYITLEMSEERIAERIDCNLLNIDIDDLHKMGRRSFVSKVAELEQKTHGKLVIKEYPTSAAHAGHFRALLDELKTKKNFIPDVIYIDYINICASQRLRGGTHNSYTIVKSIAEELRALAVEFNVPIWSATQTNRGGANNSDISVTDTSESFGLPMTLDYLFAMIRTEELDELGQIMCIQLKSRYGDINYKRKFVIGVDIKKFMLYDVENIAQEDLVDNGPAFDNSKFGAGMKAEKGFDFDFS